MKEQNECHELWNFDSLEIESYGFVFDKHQDEMEIIQKNKRKTLWIEQLHHWGE